MKNDEIFISSDLKEFLDFIYEIERNYYAAQENLSISEKELNDLIHFLELQPCSASTMVQIAKDIREIRRFRRQAKDIIDTHEPLLNWITKNNKALADLSSALGNVRKIEALKKTRAYCVRSDILAPYTNKTHLG